MFNVRGLLSLYRRTHFSDFVFYHIFDVLSLCETWLDNSVSGGELFLNDYNLVCNKHNVSKRHGGVLIALKNNIEYSTIELVLPENCCCVAIVIKTLEPFILINAYNLPKNSFFQWPHDTMRSILRNARNLIQNLTILAIGDFKLSEVDWNYFSSPSSYEMEFAETFLEFNLIQLVNFKTTSYKILDLCLSSKPERITSINEVCQNTPFSSNHKPISINLNCDRRITSQKPQKSYNFSKADKVGLAQSIQKNPFKPYCWTNPTLMVSLWLE